MVVEIQRPKHPGEKTLKHKVKIPRKGPFHQTSSHRMEILQPSGVHENDPLLSETLCYVDDKVGHKVLTLPMSTREYKDRNQEQGR